MTGEDDTEQALLAAVRAEAIAVGAGRITVAGVARRAGLSRMTVYRRAGSVEQLLLDAVTAEFVGLVRAPGARPAREQVVEDGLRVLHALQRSELIQGLHRDNPDLLLPYLLDRFGRGQLRLAVQVGDLIEAGQRDGSIRTGDPQLLARMLIMALQGFVFAPRMIDADLDTDALHTQTDQEIAQLIHGYLAPVTR